MSWCLIKHRVNCTFYLWLYSPLLDLGRFFSFLIFYAVGRTTWTGDEPVTRPLSAHWTAHTHNKRTQTSMPQVGFELTIPVSERAKTVYDLNIAATVVVTVHSSFIKNVLYGRWHMSCMARNCIFRNLLTNKINPNVPRQVSYIFYAGRRVTQPTLQQRLAVASDFAYWHGVLVFSTEFNPLKPSGYYMYHMIYRTRTLHSAHRVWCCVPYGSHNKHRVHP
jgi:hypothetical protein